MAVYTFYRAAGSGPVIYQEREGFKPRVQIELAQVRNLMSNAFDRTDHAVVIPEIAEVMHKAYEAKRDWKPIDIAREIKREKSSTTCHVSTDLGEDCGGYAAGNYVYVIEYEDLYINAILNNPSATDINPRISPKLISNAENIEDATVLAFAAGGNEVSFLTPIALENIVRYHEPDSDTWLDTPW